MCRDTFDSRQGFSRALGLECCLQRVRTSVWCGEAPELLKACSIGTSPFSSGLQSCKVARRARKSHSLPPSFRDTRWIYFHSRPLQRTPYSFARPSTYTHTPYHCPLDSFIVGKRPIRHHGFGYESAVAEDLREAEDQGRK